MKVGFFCEAEGGISEHWSKGLEINVFLRGGGGVGYIVSKEAKVVSRESGETSSR